MWSVAAFLLCETSLCGPVNFHLFTLQYSICSRLFVRVIDWSHVTWSKQIVLVILKAVDFRYVVVSSKFNQPHLHTHKVLHDLYELTKTLGVELVQSVLELDLTTILQIWRVLALQ